MLTTFSVMAKMPECHRIMKILWRTGGTFNLIEDGRQLGVLEINTENWWQGENPNSDLILGLSFKYFRNSGSVQFASKSAYLVSYYTDGELVCTLVPEELDHRRYQNGHALIPLNGTSLTKMEILPNHGHGGFLPIQESAVLVPVRD